MPKKGGKTVFDAECTHCGEFLGIFASNKQAAKVHEFHMRTSPKHLRVI